MLDECSINTCLQVTFEGITGSSYTGDVAIDQVRITAKECTGKLFKMEHRNNGEKVKKIGVLSDVRC